MPEDGPDLNNPLGPYFPSRVPPIPGDTRRWVAVLVAGPFLALLLGKLVQLLAAVL